MDTLSFIALLVCLSASWLDDACVLNLVFIGTLRTVLYAFSDIGLSIVLIAAPASSNNAPTTFPTTPPATTNLSPPSIAAKVCSSDPATYQFGKRDSIAAIAEAKAYVKAHLSNSSFGYLTQFGFVTCVLELASLLMRTLKNTSWLSFFTYVHGTTMITIALLFPVLTQLKSYFPDTPGSRYTTLIVIDSLSFAALLVCLGASWLDDACVLNLALIGTLRSVANRVWDLALHSALSSASSATAMSRPASPSTCHSTTFITVISTTHQSVVSRTPDKRQKPCSDLRIHVLE
jgi:hypothetical protein